MTTRPMPRRTMLPPNLTRHLYETRRLLAEGEGRELPAWYRLNPAERATAEMDMEVFRRAILRAEEEQDLVAAYNAGATTEPAPATFDSPTAENCSCPGCSAVAALLEIVRQARRLEDSLQARWDQNPPQESEESARGELAQKAVTRWVAAGKPLEPVTDPVEPANDTWTFAMTPLTTADLYRAMDDPAQRRFDALRLDYFNKRRPFPPRV